MSGYNKEDSINLENKCIKEIRRYETKLEWDKACQLYEKQFLKFEALEYISSDQLLNVIDFCLCLFNLARINRKVSISCLYRCQDLLNKLDEIIAKNNSSEQDYSRNLLWKLAKTLHFFFGALWTQLLYKDENSTLTLMHLIQDLNNEVEQALHNEVALDGRTKHVLGIGLLCLGEFAYRLFTVSERKVDLTRCSIGLKSLSLSEELLSKKRPNALLIYLKLLKIYIKLSYEIGYEVMEEKEKLMQKFKEVKREFNSIQKIAFRVNDFCKGIALLIKGWITYIDISVASSSKTQRKLLFDSLNYYEQAFPYLEKTTFIKDLLVAYYYPLTLVISWNFVPILVEKWISRSKELANEKNPLCVQEEYSLKIFINDTKIVFAKVSVLSKQKRRRILNEMYLNLLSIEKELENVNDVLLKYFASLNITKVLYHMFLLQQGPLKEKLIKEILRYANNTLKHAKCLGSRATLFVATYTSIMFKTHLLQGIENKEEIKKLLKSILSESKRCIRYLKEKRGFLPLAKLYLRFADMFLQLYALHRESSYSSYSRKFLYKANRIFRKVNAPIHLADSLQKTAYLMDLTGKHRSARLYFNRAADIYQRLYEKTNDPGYKYLLLRAQACAIMCEARRAYIAGKYLKARELYLEALLKFSRTIIDRKNILLCDLFMRLCKCDELFLQSNYEKAQMHYASIINLIEKALSSDYDPSFQLTLHSIKLYCEIRILLIQAELFITRGRWKDALKVCNDFINIIKAYKIDRTQRPHFLVLNREIRSLLKFFEALTYLIEGLEKTNIELLLKAKRLFEDLATSSSGISRDMFKIYESITAMTFNMIMFNLTGDNRYLASSKEVLERLDAIHKSLLRNYHVHFDIENWKQIIEITGLFIKIANSKNREEKRIYSQILKEHVNQVLPKVPESVKLQLKKLLEAPPSRNITEVVSLTFLTPNERLSNLLFSTMFHILFQVQQSSFNCQTMTIEVEHEINVSEEKIISIHFQNLSDSPSLILKLYEILPPEARIIETPPSVAVDKNNLIFLKDNLLLPGQKMLIQIKFKIPVSGVFYFRPSLLYLNANKEEDLLKYETLRILVRPKKLKLEVDEDYVKKITDDLLESKGLKRIMDNLTKATQSRD